jgi:electron transfer flavoprotein beta subunit
VALATSCVTTKVQSRGTIPRVATGWCFALDDHSQFDPVASAPIYVPMKWVGLRNDIDPLTGAVSTDNRFSGASLSDRAALETALRIGAARNAGVTVLTVGANDAEPLLRDAIAAGAQHAIRIDPLLSAGIQPTSSEVARSLASCCVGAGMVVCGDWSLDRGSGSVPPMLAMLLGYGQACGLVNLEIDVALFRAERRLDGGRREVLEINGPSVLSVEGSVASLRRAPLAGVLAAKSAVIEVRNVAMVSATPGVRVERIEAHRPTPRNMFTNNSTDPRQRVSSILGVGVQRTPPLRMTLEPDAAADVIIERLVAWGQLPA